MDHLFTYGTLMCDDIMLTVAGCLPLAAGATLRGYSRFGVKDASYPAIIKDENGIVHGRVYLNVPASALERLDLFEGAMYERMPAVIETAESESIHAYAYVCKPAFYHRLDQSVWDFYEFLQSGKKKFLESYAGFRNSDAANPH